MYDNSLLCRYELGSRTGEFILCVHIIGLNSSQIKSDDLSVELLFYLEVNKVEFVQHHYKIIVVLFIQL